MRHKKLRTRDKETVSGMALLAAMKAEALRSVVVTPVGALASRPATRVVAASDCYPAEEARRPRRRWRELLRVLDRIVPRRRGKAVAPLSR